MKVLILTNNDVGLYKFRKELLTELLKDNEVFISLPYGKFVDDMIAMGCHFVDAEFNRKGTNPIKDLKLLYRYTVILSEVKPDIVFTYTIKPNVYGGIACQKKKIPYVANVTGLGSSLENEGILQKISSFLYRQGLKGAQKVFFQNQANKDFMLKHKIVTKNHDVIPGSGVNLEEYSYTDYPSNDKINFVFVSRLMTQKGTGLYLKAAEKIKEKYENTVFHVCGPDEDGYLEKVKELEKRGIVKYYGLVENMAEIYRKIDCTIHPSYYAEGLSNILLESCASGRPVITTDKPGCIDVVKDGYNGFIIKQNDLDDLIEKMERFINLDYEKRKQMGLNARNFVEEKYDRKIIVNKYLEELDRCKSL